MRNADVGSPGADAGVQTAEYCRQIEAYLCRKNDGHLIRVTGPSFDLVADWASQGVPLKVAFQGIDRYFERYYRKGPRRRPVRIDFCEADVLDVFEEWRRATGIIQSPVASHQSSVDSHQSRVDERPRQSLPAHLERVVLKLSSARASGTLGAEADDLIDRVARELDAARADARGLRGEPRRQLIARLAILDRELIDGARGSLEEPARRDCAREAEEELAPFRPTMAAEAWSRAREAAIDRLVRDRFRLPQVAFD